LTQLILPYQAIATLTLHLTPFFLNALSSTLITHNWSALEQGT